MDVRALFPLGLLVVAGFALALVLVWMKRKGWIDTRPAKLRRGTGHALLGFQEFVEPSVAYLVQAETGEQKKEDDGDPFKIDREAIRADLAQSLRNEPVDPEEIRRHLAAAQRAGLDWRAAFEQAVKNELEARPFRAPAVPPIWRVAPRE